MKKTSLKIFLTAVMLLGMVSTVFAAENLQTVLKQFKEETEKVRDLRKANASAQEIKAQEDKVKVLRNKVAELQKQQDAFSNLGN